MDIGCASVDQCWKDCGCALSMGMLLRCVKRGKESEIFVYSVWIETEEVLGERSRFLYKKDLNFNMDSAKQNTVYIL